MRKTFLGPLLDAGLPKLLEPPFRGPAPEPLVGLRLVGADRLTVPGVIAHDRSRFIEYEDRDESWRLFFGFATRGPVPDPNLYIDAAAGCIYGHPVTIQKLVALLKGSDRVLCKPDQLPKFKPFAV